MNGWSTGQIHGNNDGVFPLMSTQIVVAKNITLRATKFNDKFKQSLVNFDSSTEIKLVSTSCIVLHAW